jgi:hypothetical protein
MKAIVVVVVLSDNRAEGLVRPVYRGDGCGNSVSMAASPLPGPNRHEPQTPPNKGNPKEPSDGLEPSTPSLPWKFRGITGVHGRRAEATKDLLLIGFDGVRPLRRNSGRSEPDGREMDALSGQRRLPTAPVSKTGMGGSVHRGFESLPSARYLGFHVLAGKSGGRQAGTWGAEGGSTQASGGLR